MDEHDHTEHHVTIEGTTYNGDPAYITIYQLPGGGRRIETYNRHDGGPVDLTPQQCRELVVLLGLAVLG